MGYAFKKDNWGYLPKTQVSINHTPPLSQDESNAHLTEFSNIGEINRHSAHISLNHLDTAWQLLKTLP